MVLDGGDLECWRLSPSSLARVSKVVEVVVGVDVEEAGGADED